jgi:hypothetical protein
MDHRHFAAVFLITGIALSGCVKQPPPPTRTQATPTPTVIDEGTDVSAQRLRRKAAETAAAVDDYLKRNQPKLHERFQKFGDKFSRDKDIWRQKLLQKKQELQPQIDALKRKAAELDPKARAAIDQETAALEQESKGADEKLNELESATADGWKEFKERLKAEDASKQDAPPTPVPSPTTTS